MTVETTDRNFQLLTHPVYTCADQASRLVQCSSAIDSAAPGGLERPGSSFLWIGQDHHLDRAEVRELIGHLEAWLATGRLET